jgi:hypothetical protein
MKYVSANGITLVTVGPCFQVWEGPQSSRATSTVPGLGVALALGRRGFATV